VAGYITTHTRVRARTASDGVKSGILTSVGLQLTVCDPIWHVCGRVSANCYTLTSLFLHNVFITSIWANLLAIQLLTPTSELDDFVKAKQTFTSTCPFWPQLDHSDWRDDI